MPERFASGPITGRTGAASTAFFHDSSDNRFAASASFLASVSAASEASVFPSSRLIS